MINEKISGYWCVIAGSDEKCLIISEISNEIMHDYRYNDHITKWMKIKKTH